MSHKHLITLLFLTVGPTGCTHVRPWQADEVDRIEAVTGAPGTGWEVPDVKAVDGVPALPSSPRTPDPFSKSKTSELRPRKGKPIPVSQAGVCFPKSKGRRK